MRRLRAWIVRVGGLWRRDRRRHEAVSEIESHLQLHIDDNIRAGLPPHEARRQALLQFGGVAAIADDLHARHGVPSIESLTMDVRVGARMLRRAPWFTLAAALTLALGVGVTTATMSLVDVLLFRPLAGVATPDRLVVPSIPNYPQLQDAVARARTLDLAGYTRQELSAGLGADAGPAQAECVTDGYFSVLGVTPAYGHLLSHEETTNGGPLSVVLSDGFWTRRFARDPSTIGQTMSIAGRSYTVVGIAPRDFHGVELGAVDVWLSLVLSPDTCSFTGTSLLASRGGAWLRTVGRLRDGRTLADARAEMAAIFADGPDNGSRRRSPDVESLADARASGARRDTRLATWIACGAAVFLLIASANLAGLLSIRAFDRHREIVVRLQLGATRTRVFRQLIVEQALLMTIGAALALPIARFVWALISRFFPVDAERVLLTPRTLAVLAAFATVAAAISGIVPAIQAVRAAGEGLLRTSLSVARVRSRFRVALLALQVGLALVLVTSAGLFVRSVQQVKRGVGYDMTHALVVSVDLRKSAIRREADIRDVFDRLLARARQMPGIEAAGMTTTGPLGSTQGVMVFPLPAAGRADQLQRMTSYVSPAYFAAIGTRIVRGRAFLDTDTRLSPPVAIVDQALAQAMWSDREAVGQCLLVSPNQPCVQVVGVSEPRRALNLRKPDYEMFFPLAQASGRDGLPQALILRTREAPERVVADVATALRGVEPRLPAVQVRPLEDLVDTEARAWRSGASIFGLFGVVANVLAALGLYGAIAFLAQQRTPEIGVRLTLGARRRDIVRMMLAEATWPLAIGLVAGVFGAIGVARWIGTLLYGVTPADPVSLVAAVVLLVIACVAGTLVPAVRASRLDPVVALRHE
jgi:predicted permease